jgi:GxxExxY protein
MSNDLLYKDEVYAIVGAAMNVHNELGCGFIEPLYQQALEIEFQELGIPYEREKSLPVYYKGIKLNKTFRPDFICFDKIIVELKAVSVLAPEHVAQVLNYLKASDYTLAPLFNFGQTSLYHRRFIR